MPFVLPEGLAPEVYPLAWLVGRWQGEGVLSYPGIEEAAFTQEVVFDHDGGPYLRYESTSRLVVVPDDGSSLVPTADGDVRATEPSSPGPVWWTETGYWRVSTDRDPALSADRHPLEVLLADPAGHLSLFVGVTGNGRIDLESDLIARTATAAEVTASTRMYGHVHGDLMWAWDLAAFGQPLQSYASARLSRVDDPADDAADDTDDETGTHA